MAAVILPVNAWSYGDPAKADDLLYEKFGPRCDRLLIDLYASQESEWDTGLETGQIDVTDWPLDSAHHVRYTTPPWNNTLKVLGYGPEFGIYLFDLNNNNNQYLGNPPNPAYPNLNYPNPMSDVDLRKACAYLSNRNKYVAFIGATTVVALYQPVGPSAGKYSVAEIAPGGTREDLCYLYNPAAANATLDAGGFPVGPDGWRYWDRNGNHVKDAGEDLNLKIVARVDDPNRDFAGSDLSLELNAAGVHTTLLRMPNGSARTQVMASKNFHIYTGGWSVGVDPDFVILWNWDFYWHPGTPYNYGGCNSPDFNVASYGVMYANDQLEAVACAQAAGIAYCTEALSVPLWAATGFKAVKRAYTGNLDVSDVEDQYEGDYWSSFVNVPGYGVDSGYSFLNLHPEGHEAGNGTGPTGTNMTIRYGFKTQEIKTMNAIYAEWLWDNAVIDLVGYDSLLRRDPYNLGHFEPWVALNYSVGTYLHPAYGTCTKCVFTVRPDVQFSDGTPLTIADIFFTFAEMDDILIERGLPPPWWYSNVKNILSFSILDPMNFEVLLDVKSVFAVGWIGGSRIMPKHIWKPICTAGDPTTSSPDPNMINSGAWRLAEYVENSHVLLVANTPDTTVETGLAGSSPMKSNNGYFRILPVEDQEFLSSPSTLYQKNRIHPNTNFTMRSLLNNRYANKGIGATMNGSYIEITNGSISYIETFPTLVNSTGPGGCLDKELVLGMKSSGQVVVKIQSWVSWQRITKRGPPHAEIYRFNWIRKVTLKIVKQTTITIDIYRTIDGVRTYLLEHRPGITIGEGGSFEILELYSDDVGLSIWVGEQMKEHWFSPESCCTWYGTIREDIAGSTYYDDENMPTYPYKSELVSPDYKVDIKDIARASGAFGSYPGHPKWNTVADITGDYKMDIKDLARISSKFGWHP